MTVSVAAAIFIAGVVSVAVAISIVVAVLVGVVATCNSASAVFLVLFPFVGDVGAAIDGLSTGKKKRNQ